jgi:hypothetical protein
MRASIVKGLLAFLILLGPPGLQAAEWKYIGSTVEHHNATDSPGVHSDAWDETRLWYVDKSSIHREGEYLLAWIQQSKSKDTAIEQRLLDVIDCDEQRHKTIEVINYSYEHEGKVLSHFVYGEGGCGDSIFSASQFNCWPNAWAPPTWDHITPESITEIIVHYVCSGKWRGAK